MNSSFSNSRARVVLLIAVSILSALPHVGCSTGANNTPSAPAGNPKVGETPVKGDDVPPEVAQALKEKAAVKAIALKNASVKVYHAYHYAGPTTTDPIATAKAIAVDVEFAKYSPHFKLWDVDIVDAKTNENFGSDPDVAFLNGRGEFLTFDESKIDFTKPIRLLMIYAVPKTTSSVRLSYWGQDLTPDPILLEDKGLSLPKRK